jgi:general secretion pathway protein F
MPQEQRAMFYGTLMVIVLGIALLFCARMISKYGRLRPHNPLHIGLKISGWIWIVVGMNANLYIVGIMEVVNAYGDFRQEKHAMFYGTLMVIVFGIALLFCARMISKYGRLRRFNPLLIGLNLSGCLWIVIGIFSNLYVMGILEQVIEIIVLIVVFSLLYGIPVCVLIYLIVFAYITRRILNRQHALLWLLAVSAEKSIPLVPLVEAFARECGGRFSRRLTELAELLTSGMLLPFALVKVPRLLPLNVLPLIQVGYESGALASALRHAAPAQRLHKPAVDGLIGRFLYLCGVLCIGAVVITFLMLKIVPQFIKIFKDFDAKLPLLTRLIINVTDGLAPLALLIIGMLPLAALAVLIYAMLRSTGRIMWDLPGMGRLTRRADTALIFESLALATEHQQPLPKAIECLAVSYPKEPVRRLIRAALADINAGRDWCESLLARGLIRPADQGVLQAAERVGNLTWALREMADSNRRRMAYRLYAAVQLLYPVVILMLGALVMCVVVGLFLPMIALIQKMAH